MKEVWLFVVFLFEFQNHSSLIIDLRNAAFGTDSGPKKPGQTNAIEYQKLGFEVSENCLSQHVVSALIKSSDISNQIAHVLGALQHA